MTSFDPDRHHRRSVRLRGYDYAGAGTYFVTLCTHQRECLSGDVVEGVMRLSSLGEVATEEWTRSAALRPGIRLGPLIVMPNHIHGIMTIVGGDVVEANPIGTPEVGAHSRAPLQPLQLHRAPRSLGSFVSGYKAAVTKRINGLRETAGTAVWQRNYYERIIRNQGELDAIRDYIDMNPAQWHLDRENPASAPSQRSEEGL